MTDNGDGTWSYTFMSDTAATYQYKFINGNAWGSDEQAFPARCAYDGNRQIEVDGMMGDVSSSLASTAAMHAVHHGVVPCGHEQRRGVAIRSAHRMGDFQGWDPRRTQ